jgi:hypothetical protein
VTADPPWPETEPPRLEDAPPAGHGSSGAFAPPGGGPPTFPPGAGAHAPGGPAGYAPAPPGRYPPYPYPGWQPTWGPPPYPPPRRRRWPAVAVGFVAVLGLAAAAAVVVRSGGGDHPDEWDERVAPLAEFVERERGLSFDHPVTVEFLTEEEYSAAARTDEGALSDEDRRRIDEWGAVFAALGLLPEGTDLFDTTNEMADSGTLAFYDPATERVTVRGTAMSTGLAVTLVHELVHVAQDQAFDLEQPPPGTTSGASEAYDALIEGDASRIELGYVATLSSAEQTAYWDEYDTEYDESQEQLSDVPGALQALFAAPYVLGQPVVDIIASDGGNAAVDDAFGDPPASGEHLFDPRSYFAGDAPEDVDAPDVPAGAERVGSADELGATTLFVLLSERIDPLEALAAADGWGGDRYAAYRLDDRPCVRVDLVGDSATDTDEIARALGAWAAAGPAGAASVDAADGAVGFESCAAPTEAAAATGTEGRSYDALGLPAARAQLMAVAAGSGRDPDEAFAVGDCFVRSVSFDLIVEANQSAVPPQEIVDAVERCMAG